MDILTHLDLCSGIGGFHLAAEWAGFQTAGFAEIEPYCCKLLAEKWPEIKNYGDLRTADFSPFTGKITVLSAGVPCQPASLAGKRKGKDDSRWLWDDVCRVIELVRPAWCIFENPPGILTLGEFRGILLRMESEGYQIGIWQVPANAVGAKHRRQRVFIVANAGSRRCDRQGERQDQQSGRTETIGSSQTLADAEGNATGATVRARERDTRLAWKQRSNSGRRRLLPRRARWRITNSEQHTVHANRNIRIVPRAH